MILKYNATYHRIESVAESTGKVSWWITEREVVRLSGYATDRAIRQQYKDLCALEALMTR